MPLSSVVPHFLQTAFAMWGGFTASLFLLMTTCSSERLRSIQSTARNVASRAATVVFAAATFHMLSANALEMAPAAKEVEELSSGVDKSGLLRRCSGACLSSQDDTPRFFIPPLCYDGPFERMAPRLVEYLKNALPNSRIVSPLVLIDFGGETKPNRYIRALVVQGGGGQEKLQQPQQSQQRFTDELEFYFTPNDNTIQFRFQHLGEPVDFGGVNRRRLEDMVRVLGLDYVPVLRNRMQQWWSFGLDTPFDEFGPNLPMD